MKKTLLIVKTFYLEYCFLFFFDNVNNYSIYTRNVIELKNIYK